MTFDQFLAETRSRGLRVINLFELEDGRWQANLTRESKAFNFGRGASAGEAMAAAIAEYDKFQDELSKAASRQPKPVVRQQEEEDLFA